MLEKTLNFLGSTVTQTLVELHIYLKLFTTGNDVHRRRQWHPTPVLLPGKSHGRRSLVGCSPWDRQELDMTEQLHFHFSLSCIGQGNGNPLQCSLPGESQGRGSLVGCRLWGRTESDTTEATQQQLEMMFRFVSSEAGRE